jgi:hypothetical protein
MRKTGSEFSRGRAVGRFGLWLIAAVFCLRCGWSEAAATTEPEVGEAAGARLFAAGSGRFEVIAEAGVDGVRLAELGEAAWRAWRDPLGLPVRLPNAITVRLVPEALWGGNPRAHRTSTESGGAVTVWIRAGGEPGVARERLWLGALAEGALARRAALVGLDPARASLPAWLRVAAAEAAIVAERVAMLDAWQAAMRDDEAPARLREVLLWDGRESSAELERAAFGVWLWLREGGARSGAWTRLVTALQVGDAPGAALAREFGSLTSRPSEAREWELVWRVNAARLARARATPLLEPTETRLRLERTARIVVWDSERGEERVLAATGGWDERGEPWLEGERAARAGQLAGEFIRLHPFYRNAAGSLGRAWLALAEGREADWSRARKEFAQDMETGRELEQTSARLLAEAERAAR